MLELPNVDFSVVDVFVVFVVPKRPCLGGSEPKLNEGLVTSVLVTIVLDVVLPNPPNDGFAVSVTVEFPNKDFGGSVLATSFLTGAGAFVDRKPKSFGWVSTFF